VATAADLRNTMPNLGPALLDIEQIRHPDYMMLAFTLSRKIKELQAEGNAHAAAGLMVWLHTARAATDSQLRYLAKDMWAELERGFPFVDEAAEDIEMLVGKRPNVVGAAFFPLGLNPHE
jgi:hypothetical protein